MSSELSQAIQQVCDEKNISVESVIESIESALAAAYRKDFGNKLQNLEVKFDIDSGSSKIFDVKEVVADQLKIDTEAYIEEKKKASEEGKELPLPEDGEEIKRFNPKNMITLTEVKDLKKDSKIGDIIRQELDIPDEYGRMAAQTAKQVIIQKLREAERDAIFLNYQDRQGELISGTVQRMDGGAVLVDLGDATAIISPQDQSRLDNYKPGAKLKFYVRAVEQTPKGPEINLSRAHPEMLRKLFKLEVPEIGSGSVQIKGIAREAGSRSKVSVWTKDDSIDPIGSCVGQRGTRVQTIINEVGGEKLDIIEWNEDTVKYISNSLSPAKILNIELNDKEKQAKAYVKEDQYSLAIGKAGQNVRLAAKLTGWKIDIIQEKKEDIPEAGEDQPKDEVDDNKDQEVDKKNTDFVEMSDGIQKTINKKEENKDTAEDKK